MIFGTIIIKLLKIDNTDIFWAIPMGDLSHRNKKQKDRIMKYISKDKRNL